MKQLSFESNLGLLRFYLQEAQKTKAQIKMLCVEMIQSKISPPESLEEASQIYLWLDDYPELISGLGFDHKETQQAYDFIINYVLKGKL